MRALYLFINGLSSSNPDRRRHRDIPWDASDDAGLTPIRPGAFARWMTARDAGTMPAETSLPAGGRGRRELLPR